MAKALKFIGLAALALTAVAFVGTGLAVGFAGLHLTTVGQALVLGGLLSFQAGNSLLAKKRLNDSIDSNLQVRKTSTEPRKIAYGKVANAGAIIYQEEFGDQNITSTIIAVAGHEISGFEKFKWGDDVISFAGNNAVGEFHDHMFLFEHLGDDNQLADTDLVNLSSKWTADHRLRGVAYAHLKLVFNHELFDKGFLNTLFIFKGRKIYDPRKDSTVGGSGLHRLSDESTWEWSDNPVLCIADYLRGIKVGGTLIAGMGIANSRIDWPNIIAEANICDELVALKNAGSEKRYTCNVLINPENEHRTNLEILASSMAGTIVFQGGFWRVYAATPRAALKTRSTDQVFGPVKLSAKKGISQKINSVRGVYLDESEDFAPKDYPPRQNQSYINEDGGYELWLDLNLHATTSVTMAQRISKIMLERSRQEKHLDLTFFPVALQDQAMDAVNFSYTPFNISNEKFLVADWAFQFTKDDNDNVGFLIKETLIEERDSVYDWNPEVDEVDVPVGGKAPSGKKITDQRAISPVNVAGALVSVETNPLSAVDEGITARIDIAQHTRQYGFGSVSYNAGSITGLSFDTLYFIFTDDPLLQGGDVTYLSTTSRTEVTNGNDRIFIGEITTPSDGGGATSGSGGSGLLGGSLA